MGGKSYKFVSPQHRGVPDQIAFFPGGFIILAEMKRPGGKLTPLQNKIMKEFQSLDTPYVVIDSLDAVRDFKENVSLALDNLKGE
jgi:hypothetical protein